MVRGLALLAFGGALIVLVTDWAVRHRHLPPDGRWARLVDRSSAPLLAPLERRLHRSGGNPADAPLWLLGVVIVAGLLALGLVRWIAGTITVVGAMEGAPPAAWVRLILGAAIGLVMAAIMVRVIGSWLGLGRHTRGMRVVYLLTDWIIAPIARRMPPTGMLDLSPIVAYVALLLLRGLVQGALR